MARAFEKASNFSKYSLEAASGNTCIASSMSSMALCPFCWVVSMVHIPFDAVCIEGCISMMCSNINMFSFTVFPPAIVSNISADIPPTQKPA
eukprot:11695717-Ditylum_brightwellii.AAC.1